MKKSVFFYVTGVLMMLVLAFLAGLLLNTSVENRKAQGSVPTKPALDLPDGIPWDKIPWRDFPENFPWDEVPWESFPEDTDWENLPWQEIPWDKIPEDAKSGDIQWNKIPWESLPEDFSYESVPWESVPWGNLPKDIPYGDIQWDKIPWESLPEDFSYENVPWESVPWEKLPKDIPYGDIQWDKIPWESLPEDFPYENVPFASVPWEKLPKDIPYGDIQWDKIPWGSLPEDFSYENVPWESVPWEKLPKDIPYGDIQWDKIPWESLPEDFPYENVPFASVPWEKLPKDIPYGDIQWDKIPWESMPEDFPYEDVPWDNLPDDYPWTQPETGCKHKYSDWETVKEATCGEPGVEKRKCDVCGNVETRVIPPTKKHNFDDDGECSVCHVQRLKLKSRSAEEVYGGAPLKCEEYDVLEGKIKEGHTVKGVYKKLDSVGVADNIFTVTLADAAGKDVTASYIIEYEYGTLRLMQLKITVTTGSAFKKYDGTELICAEYFIDGLAQGDRAELTFREGQTERGRRENVASVKIYNEDGEDVTANYAIETIFGILLVE